MKLGYHVAKDTWFVYEWTKHNRQTINTRTLLEVYQKPLYDIQENGDIVLRYSQNIRIFLTPENCRAFVPTQIPREQVKKMLKNICQMLENFTVNG